MISAPKLVATTVGHNALFFELRGPQYIRPPAREFTVDTANDYQPSEGGPPAPLQQFITGPIQKATGAEIYPPTAAAPTPTQPGVGEPLAAGAEPYNPPPDAPVQTQVEPGQGQMDPLPPAQPQAQDPAPAPTESPVPTEAPAPADQQPYQ